MSDDQVVGLDNTSVIFGNEAKSQLLAGAAVVAEAVGCTMGPRGRTVLIQQKGKAPVLTKDGVTVSKAVKLADPVQRMGGDLLREAASRTNDVAGDGTTTATVLTHAMMSEAHRLLTAGHGALELSRGIEDATAKVITWLQTNARQVTTRHELENVATISANGDSSIGKLIADAMEKVGRHGIVTVEDAKGTITSLELAQGMQLDRGYLSPYFVTNNEKMAAIYDNCYVLVTDKKISTIDELVPTLETIHRISAPVLIIADEIEGEALQTLVINRVKSNLKVIAIKSPGLGSAREQMLEDVAILCGTKVVSNKTGDSLKTVTLDNLGVTSRVIVSAKGTTLISNGKTREKVDQRLVDLEINLLDPTLSLEESSVIRMRMARLAGGVAVIKVGGSTEVEMIERRYRIEDALNATRAASEEGIIPGGGTALWAASREVLGSAPADKIVRAACHEPLRRITDNSGKNTGVVEERLNTLWEEGKKYGYNAASDTYQDMFSAGVIDPVKVTRTALENASSVAAAFTSMGAAICDQS